MKKLLLVLAATLFAAVSTAASAQEKTEEQPDSIRGIVQDEQQKPIAGAAVHWYLNLYDEKIERRGIAVARSDAEGKFVLKADSKKLTAALRESEDTTRGASVYVLAPGRALGMRSFWNKNTSDELKFTLLPEKVVTGRVADSKGKPLPGAKISVVTVYSQAGAAPGDESYVTFTEDANFLATATDARGEFLISNMPRDAHIYLHVAPPAKQSTRFASLSAVVSTSLNPQPLHYGNGVTVKVPSNRVLVTLTPPAILRGRVLLADTKRPVADASIHIWAQRRSETAETNAKGEFLFKNLPAGKYTVQISPSPEAEAKYIGAQKQAELKAGTNLPLTVSLPRGVLVTGKVVDAESGAPISSGQISGYMPPADGDENGQSFDTEVESDGTWQMAVAPGKVNFSIHSLPAEYTNSDEDYDPGRQIQREVKLGAKVEPVIIRLPRTQAARVRVLSPEGRPVAGARIKIGWNDSASTDAKGEAVLHGFKKGSSRQVTVYDDSNKLAAVASVSASDEPTEIRLQPMAVVSGRIIDSSGKPIGGAKAYAMLHSENRANTITTVFSDAEGKLRLSLPADGDYSLNVGATNYGGKSVSRFKATAGEMKELETIQLGRADLVLTGVVVDPSGKPIPDVRLGVWGEGQNSESNFSPRTDKNGRFRIEGLAPGTVSLHVSSVPGYEWTSTQAKAGDKDFKLVLTPKFNPKPTVLKAGIAAPDFAITSNAYPNLKKLSSLRGRVVLLAFVSDTQPGLRALEKLSAWKTRHSALSILPVSEVWNEKASTPLPIVTVQSSGLPGYSAPYQAYRVRFTPSFFLIDRKGVLRFADIEAAQLDSKIKVLLAEK